MTRRKRGIHAQWDRFCDEFRELGHMTLAFWSEDAVVAPELAVDLTLVPNYEDIWIEAKDDQGVIDFEETSVEYSPAGADTWTTCRKLGRCIGAADSRHIGVIEHDIDGTATKDTSYDVRLTYLGQSKTATTTTRDDPGGGTYTNSATVSTVADIITECLINDNDITVTDGDYYFTGANTIVFLAGTSNVRLRAQNPGNVRFHGWQDVNGLDGSWTNVGSGVWSHAVTGGLADKQWCVHHNESILAPIANLARLQDERKGFTNSGATGRAIPLQIARQAVGPWTPIGCVPHGGVLGTYLRFTVRTSPAHLRLLDALAAQLD